MKSRSLVLIAALIASTLGCASQPAQQVTEPATSIPTPIPATSTPSPIPNTPTPTILPPTPTETSTPAPAPYCDDLYETYTPAEGFKLYCDEQYDYAFEYPGNWVIEGLDRPTPNPTDFPGAYPQLLVFHDAYAEHQVYIYTARLPEGETLKDIAENDHSYDDRAFQEEYPPMNIGGKPAYGYVNRYVQDYSGVSLFFEHGEYYTLMYMKIILKYSLDAEWQVAHSIQVPGASPEDNVIPQELIEDSYTLL